MNDDLPDLNIFSLSKISTENIFNIVHSYKIAPPHFSRWNYKNKK